MSLIFLLDPSSACPGDSLLVRRAKSTENSPIDGTQCYSGHLRPACLQSPCAGYRGTTVKTTGRTTSSRTAGEGNTSGTIIKNYTNERKGLTVHLVLARQPTEIGISVPYLSNAMIGAKGINALPRDLSAMWRNRSDRS